MHENDPGREALRLFDCIRLLNDFGSAIEPVVATYGKFSGLDPSRFTKPSAKG